MKILFLTPDYPPDVVGGIGPYTKEVVGALASRGHEVHVLACRQGAPNQETKDGDVFIHSRGWQEPRRRGFLTRAPQSALRWRAASEVARHARKLGRFDVIEAPDWAAFALRLPASVPIVLHLHTPFRVHAAHQGEFSRWDVTWADRMERSAVRKASVVTAPSKLVVHESQRAGWKIGSDVEIIRYGISASAWSVGESAQDTKPVILFVGRLERRKAPDVLIRAVAEISTDIPDLHVVFVGPAAQNRVGRAYADHLRSLVEQLPVRCTFTGKQTREDLRAWYRQARVAVIPSHFDNFPMAGLEALAAGRPLVVTSRVGLAETLEGSGAGAIVPPQDPRQMARALHTYLSDPGSAGRAGQKSAELVRREFEPKRIAAQREQVFRRAISIGRATN